MNKADSSLAGAQRFMCLDELNRRCLASRRGAVQTGQRRVCARQGNAYGGGGEKVVVPVVENGGGVEAGRDTEAASRTSSACG